MTASPNADLRQYGKLLSRVLPAVIETEKENERMLAELNKLMDKPNLSPAESKLFDLMVRLIEDFEEQHYELNASTPHGILRELMEARGVKQRDLWELFGSKGTASEVINGKRSISKTQAKALGKYFRVSPELFL
jgi:HTH-type transcriptional regulator / antitoxin HigA